GPGGGVVGVGAAVEHRGVRADLGDGPLVAAVTDGRGAGDVDDRADARTDLLLDVTADRVGERRPVAEQRNCDTRDGAAGEEVVRHDDLLRSSWPLAAIVATTVRWCSVLYSPAGEEFLDLVLLGLPALRGLPR